MRVGPAVAVLLILMSALPIRGAAIDQMRERLAALKGTTPVAGRFEIEESDLEKTNRPVRHARAEFQCDPITLDVRIPASDLIVPPGGEEAETASLNLHRLWATLNAAPPILDALRQSTVISERAVQWRNRPAVRLEVSLKPDPPKNVPRMLKLKLDVRQVFWLTPEGTPLAVETHAKFSARFLVVSGGGEEKSSAEYAVVGDRLVAVREVDDSTSAAMGEKGRRRTVRTVTLRR
jgi:hypothetical protein